MRHTAVNVLQVGLGNFGKRHLEAWHRLGFTQERLWVAESDQAKWHDAAPYHIPTSRVSQAITDAIEHVQIVDIVTPTEQHLELARQALADGKDVFIEKPMTMTSVEARQLLELAEKTKRLVQVGYYYRFHPASQRLKKELMTGRLGKIRYITGNFCGFKRARTDVGVAHTDGIHFLDLFNWLLESFPVEVYAVCRDHFGRSLEDFAIVLLTYPAGTVGKVESGYIQPGRWPDKVVPGAMTTKEIVVVGEAATAEIDFEAETLVVTNVHHEQTRGIWTPVFGSKASIPIEPCEPAQLICRELEAFLTSVKTREATAAGPVECGINLAVLMEGLYESAKRHEPVRVDASSLVGTR